MSLDITEEQADRIEAGVDPIQTIVPHLSPDEREFLITGIISDSWDQWISETKEETND